MTKEFKYVRCAGALMETHVQITTLRFVEHLVGLTYVYDDFYQNLLWKEPDDRLRLDGILRGKREFLLCGDGESRMRYEHSEDAVTWNVFRFFERHACLSSTIKGICSCPTEEPLTVFWTMHKGCLWEPFQRCSNQIPEKVFARSEPDLIFFWEDKLVVIIEAKFRSPNRSEPKKRNGELRKARRYIERASNYFNQEAAFKAAQDGWYELLRNWALGATIKDMLGCEAFVLVNLLRRRHESILGENPRQEFAERACVLSSISQFSVAYWEDLITAAPCSQADSAVLIRWARNKSELLGKPAFDL